MERIPVLEQWKPFLYEREFEYQGGSQKRYRIYHGSYYEFIANKEEVKDKHLDENARKAAIEVMWRERYRDE
jgi:hypothetical protein